MISLAFLATASEQAEKIKPLIYYFSAAALFVFLVVAVLLIFVCIKFRSKPGAPEPKQTTGNIKIEILTVGSSIALVVLFFFLSLHVMQQIEPAPKNQTPDAIITGHQWWWEVYYPRKGVIAANEIHLPAGKKLLIEMKSADVIHDWCVPALGPKIDLIPGQTNHLWLTIKKPGIYFGQCNLFCGVEHARMRIRLIVQTPADFQQWLNENKKIAQAPADTLQKIGAALFQTKTCSNCHRITGTAASGDAGPDLTHFASRKTMLANMMINNKKNLTQWISHPQQVKPGAHMPDFIFNQDTVKAIVDYLSALK